ncbi:putative secreted hydrolase [Pseudoalteromonas luteoviolacea B = ATCC 29581]|nr:putative secreted hydrolase [Pseudoalteromonas luteoviolacea B = ATCC 29581]
MKKWFMLSLISAALSASVFADDEPKIDWKTQQLSENVYVLFGRGGNIAVHVGDDGIYLVDDQFANLSEQIKAQIASLKPGVPEFVINTHYHGDHTGGNENFAKAGSHVIAHHHVHARLEDKHGADSDALPRLTFGNDMTLHFNNEHAHIRHYPNAHTDGDAAVFFPKADVIHFGDMFFNTGGLPYVDVEGGGSVNGLLAALKDLNSQVKESTKLIPGHGPVASKADLVRYIELIEGAKAKMLAAMAKHDSEEAVLKADPLEGMGLSYASWLPKERVTKLFYQSLSQK